MWADVIAQLSQYHCLAVDLPGHAQSAHLEWTSGEEVAQQLNALIREQAHQQRAHVVGLSLGGYIALHLLAQAPQVVRDVVISGVPDRPIPFGWLIRVVGVTMAPFIHSERLIRASAKSLHIPAHSMETYVSQVKLNSKQAFRRINQQAVKFAPPAAALTGETRKLFLAGSREHPLIKKALSNFSQAPATTSALVPGLGHGWSGEDPKLFAETVACWIEGRALPEALRMVDVPS